MGSLTGAASYRAIGPTLRALRSAVAREVTDRFFDGHPECLALYGESGRERTLEDAGHHLDFLRGALESGSVAAFEAYASWACRVLRARNVPAHLLVSTFELMDESLTRHLENGSQEPVREMLRAGIAVCAGIDETAPPLAVSGMSLAGETFLHAILCGQRAAAVKVVQEALREGHPILDVYVDVVERALCEVGRSWESNRITVAEEHAATALAQYVLARMYSELPLPEVQRGKLLITGVAGEQHQIGANLVSDVLESVGFNVRFLGTNLPHAGILSAIEAHAPQIVGISATVLPSLLEVTRLIEQVRARFGAAAPQIMLGGSAFRGLPDHGKEYAASVGAIGVAGGLREALKLVLPPG